MCRERVPVHAAAGYGQHDARLRVCDQQSHTLLLQRHHRYPVHERRLRVVLQPLHLSHGVQQEPGARVLVLPRSRDHLHVRHRAARFQRVLCHRRARVWQLQSAAAAAAAAKAAATPESASSSAAKPPSPKPETTSAAEPKPASATESSSSKPAKAAPTSQSTQPAAEPASIRRDFKPKQRAGVVAAHLGVRHLCRAARHDGGVICARVARVVDRGHRLLGHHKHVLPETG